MYLIKGPELPLSMMLGEPEIDGKKKCWKCGDEKDAKKDFCRDGKDSVCKKCRYELNSEWAKENREKLRPKRAAYMREYRAKKAARVKLLQDIANNRANPPKPEEE